MMLAGCRAAAAAGQRGTALQLMLLLAIPYRGTARPSCRLQAGSVEPGCSLCAMQLSLTLTGCQPLGRLPIQPACHSNALRTVQDTHEVKANMSC